MTDKILDNNLKMKYCIKKTSITRKSTLCQIIIIIIM